MKLALGIAVLLVGNLVQAAPPPDLGHFKGVVFSSATNRHPLEIEGGHLVKCEAVASVRSDITTCEVEKGALSVSGNEWSTLNVNFSRVSVLRTLGKTATRNYYFRGTADLVIGAQTVTSPVRMTVTVEDSAPNRVRGIIDLTDQYAKSSFEAYLVK